MPVSGTGMKLEAPGPDVLERRLAAADRPGEHLWVAAAAWQVDPRAWQGGVVHLDMENLLDVQGAGCFKCEQRFSNRVARRPCRGSVDA